MLTEDQAKTKWCPHSRAADAVSRDTPFAVSANRDSGEGYGVSGACMCLASACMAWQFADKEHRRDTELWSRSGNRRAHSVWSDDAWWRPVGSDAEKEPPEPVGFCGIVAQVTP